MQYNPELTGPVNESVMGMHCMSSWCITGGRYCMERTQGYVTAARRVRNCTCKRAFSTSSSSPSLCEFQQHSGNSSAICV